MIHIDSSCSNNWSASVSLRKATCRTCGTALSRAGGGLFLSARTPKESDQFQVSHSSRRKSTPQTTSCRKSPPRPPRKRIERSHQILGEQMSKRIASSVAVCLPLAGNIWTHTPPKPRSGRGIFFATALHNPSFRWIPGEPITGGLPTHLHMLLQGSVCQAHHGSRPSVWAARAALGRNIGCHHPGAAGRSVSAGKRHTGRNKQCQRHQERTFAPHTARIRMDGFAIGT